jgi:hypothetical protein
MSDEERKQDEDVEAHIRHGRSDEEGSEDPGRRARVAHNDDEDDVEGHSLRLNTADRVAGPEQAR